MVVGGKALINVAPNPTTPASAGFLYFMSEADCTLKWLFLVPTLDGGIFSVKFDPGNPSRIYGIAESL